ncbi:16S rRNA (uracil(1498)-N(3))-methyltransferase [Glutamicibacter sp.]|uniref:16S rRNA (uracil(1498)-N(3))-methyltransferase n=1 Tax=Glutamicibacter sp. TaxID=1931995 RepID=UPI0028BE7FB0|nr:16S rRNA (uracil(1498)-N(3))-methyltransferase [Glutamicibacter sp.]
MSNHSFVIDPQQAESARVGDVLELTGPEAHHAVAVKRTQVGEHLDLLDGRGLRLIVEVLGASNQLLSVRVIERVEEPPPAHPTTLIQALSKGDRDLQAVESAVELGVWSVRPWQADRSIVRWNAGKVEKAMAKWRSLVRSAQKQSRRSYEPDVLDPMGSKALAQKIQEHTDSGDLVLVLHEQAKESVASVCSAWIADAPERTGVVLIVGPEGGISDAELAAFEQAGAKLGLLGRHVLRASTAGPSALVLVRHIAGDL